jgi:hypothetical protein
LGQERAEINSESCIVVLFGHPGKCVSDAWGITIRYPSSFRRRHSALSSLISANRRLIAWGDVSLFHGLWPPSHLFSLGRRYLAADQSAYLFAVSDTGAFPPSWRSNTHQSHETAKAEHPSDTRLVCGIRRSIGCPYVPIGELEDDGSDDRDLDR